MNEYGVTSTGFVPKRLDIILEEIHSDLSEGFGIDTRLNAQSYLNVLVTNFADKIAELWEVAQDSYDAMYPFSAEDLSLDNVAQFGGVTREEAKPTYYPIHVECVDGTTLPKNTRIKSNTNPAKEFILLNDTTITRNSFNEAKLKVVVRNSEVYSVAIDGNLYSYTSSKNATVGQILDGIASTIVSDVFSVEIVEETLVLEVLDKQKPCALTLSGNLTTESVTSIVNFASVENGEIILQNETITEIVTAVTGLKSVVNLSGYIAGRERETDVELRRSYVDKIFARSSRMLDSIKSAILLNVQGIISVQTYENDQDETDEYGRPPHSIEIIVEGGDNTQIATIIDDYKSGGIQTFGDIKTIIPGDNGESIEVSFNRPTSIYVWYRIIVTLNGSEAMPSDYVELIKEAVKQYTLDVEIGATIIPKRINVAIYNAVAGDFYTVEVEAVTTDDISVIPSEFSKVAIPLSVRERVVTDSTRIEVVLSE